MNALESLLEKSAELRGEATENLTSAPLPNGECEYFGDSLICLSGLYENHSNDVNHIAHSCNTSASKDAIIALLAGALEYAGCNCRYGTQGRQAHENYCSGMRAKMALVGANAIAGKVLEGEK